MKRICQLLLLVSSLQMYAQQNSSGSLRQKAITLCRFLEKNHYEPVTWNDSSSALLYKKWIEQLDEEKLFLTRADMALLDPFKTKLDDELSGKGWDFFNRSTALYKTGLQRADSLVQALLSKPFDLSKPDDIHWPGSNYALNNSDLALRWHKFLKWRVLENIASRAKDGNKPLTEIPQADFAKMESEAREKVLKKERYFISNQLKTPAMFSEEMADKFLNTLSGCYDPHTNYMNIGRKKEFDAMVTASEFSAGFELEKNEKGEKAISYLQPGGSAWRSGQLHTGDQLLKLKSGGVEKNINDIEDDDELKKMLTGTSQSDLEVTVRTAAGEEKTVKLSKEKITAEEGIVKSYVLHGSKNIGYINLPGFYSREDDLIEDERDLKYDGCANDVSKEIVKLKKDTIAGLILDFRNNGGGSMWEAIQLAGIFIDIGPVASSKDKDGKVQFLKDPNRGTIYDGPLLVLINGASASASEFVSAVLQDYNRAIVVGGNSYGKGTAQVVLPLDTLEPSPTKTYTDFVKVTQDKFYRVNGSTTQWKGVTPDIDLPDLYSDEFYKERSNSSALRPDNSKAGLFQALPVLPVEPLKMKSGQRISADPYFKNIIDLTRWMKEYRTGRIIPLQWDTYSAHYARIMNMFNKLNQENELPDARFQVTNNGFDKQRIDASTSRSKDINNTYLRHVTKDMVLREAYSIMLDWVAQ